MIGLIKISSESNSSVKVSFTESNRKHNKHYKTCLELMPVTLGKVSRQRRGRNIAVEHQP
jgi:hypothetical protein